MTFTVLHAPLHGPSAKKHPAMLRKAIRDVGADSVGPTEAYGCLPELAKMSEYRTVMERGGADTRRGQKDNPILVRSRLRSLGSGQVFGCDASEPVKIAPERWFTYSVVQVPRIGDVMHLTMHPHAVVQSKDTGLILPVPRGREFTNMMLRFDSILTWAEKMGWAIVVTADFNFRDHGTAANSPYRIMRRHNLDVVSVGLDGVGSSKRLKMDVSRVSRPDGISNHPWLRARAVA